MNPIDFGCQRSKVKVTMGIIYKCGVRGDATLCVVIFYFDMSSQNSQFFISVTFRSISIDELGLIAP